MRYQREGSQSPTKEIVLWLQRRAQTPPAAGHWVVETDHSGAVRAVTCEL
jgi:hypothetical protein